MRRWIAGSVIALLLIGTPGLGAELFYMDHDPLSKEYVGPVGPLVLSGDIEPGDYDRLLTKIAEDENRFIGQNKLILASAGGDVPESIRIAGLVKSLYTEILVGPLTGRCIGTCFLIYAAASQRGTDGQRLLGIHRPQPDDSEAQARDFLRENEVPPYLTEEMFRHTSNDVYWLSERDEKNLGARSPFFAQYLASKCAWSDTLERSVYMGERPIEDLKEMWACRTRVTQPAARKALALALKAKSNPDANGTEKAPPGCRKKDAKCHKLRLSNGGARDLSAWRQESSNGRR
jgi:hypothetical protein